MANKIFQYDVNLVPLTIENKEQATFRAELNDIPYLLYEVEQITTGEKIAINKPGGKRNFGRLSRDDFMVFIYTPMDKSLWLISHNEIKDDLAEKEQHDRVEMMKLMRGLHLVCQGLEPDAVIAELGIVPTVGIAPEIIMKAYKWIWGQEDCNYPTKQGRWLSMNALIERFGLPTEGDL